MSRRTVVEAVQTAAQALPVAMACRKTISFADLRAAAARTALLDG